MKILIDARFYGLENGGIGRYTNNLLDELAKIDHDNKYHILLRKKYFGNLKFPENWTKYEADWRHYGIAEQIKIPGLIKRINPDLTHFLHFNVPLRVKGDFVVTIHDTLMHKLHGKSSTTLPIYKYLVKRLGYKTVFSNAVKGSEKIIVPSKVSKNDLISYYKINSEKIIITHEGYPENKSNKDFSLEKYKLSKPYVFYIGNTYPHKNIDRAIEAVSFYNKRAKQKIAFAIASPDNHFSKLLKSRIEKLGASSDVNLLGFVPDEDVFDLYKNSLAMIYPSLLEGFGLQGLEAMAAGTIVLASDIPVFKEIYAKHAMYFNPYDFSSIEKSIETVVELDRSKRRKIILDAKKFVKKYSWQKMAKETLNVYEDVLR